MLTTQPPLDRDAALARVYPGLLKWYARRFMALYEMRPGDLDDVAQEAAVFFLQRWDPGRSGHPVALAKFAVHHAARRFHGRARRERNTAREWADRRAAWPDAPPPEPVVAAVRGAVAVLNPAMQRLLSDRFGLDGQEPKTTRQTAGRRESHQNISLKLRTCLARARLALTAAGAEVG